ncbi:type I restriction endonuclease subunit R [Desulfobacterales bacterium HSG16]|nr:type I restriction endonuclease subunit R [Desulfobacterales bacterium HSG16]
MTSQTPEYLQSELPAINLFQQLGYEYFDASVNDERESINDVVLISRLKASIGRINPWLNENNVNQAVREITAITSSSLMEANEKIHRLISGKNFTPKQVIDGREQYIGVGYIDFSDIENNDFIVVNQMKFKGQAKNSIPDIVVFVNGLPLAVIECKSPILQEAEARAISDLLYYQQNSEKLFRYNQICVGIYKVGGRYGALGAKEEHYQVYRDDNNNDNDHNSCAETIEAMTGKAPTAQDILIYNLFDKKKFFDIIRNFTIFEMSQGARIKKLPRYQQIRATNKTIEKLQKENKGGVIWHTQGSGKSITMVYIATKLKRDESGFNNPTIIIVTDRTDLDDQIFKTFNRCGFPNPISAASVRHLKKLLKDGYGKTITTTIQKFQETDKDGNIIKVCRDKIETISEKENLYVLVDEAHRTQYGFLAGFMRKALTNAKFIAFTGTPIDNEQKSTLGSFYGGKYLDVYTIKQSVADGATLPILYEDGLPDLYVEKELLEKQFKYHFDGETAKKQVLLKKEATSMKKYMAAKQRIKRIAEHIIEHYKTKIYPNGYKAMVVCYNRACAIAYKSTFDELKENGKHGFSSRVVMSFSLKKDPQEYYKIATPESEVKKVIEDFTLPFGDESVFSRGGKKQFNNDAIMIVSDMLLTGYDVPVAQVMYLDKPLKAHNLLQAIARVNRTRGAKAAGFVVDYCGITDHLIDAMNAFEDDLAPEDVMGSISEEITRLKLRHNRLTAFFQDLKIDRKKQREIYIEKAVQYLEPEDIRDKFKGLLKKFNQSLNIVLPDESALCYKNDFVIYAEIRLEAANAYVDKSLKISEDESKKLQLLIDEHLRARGIINLLDEPVSIIDVEKFEEELANTKSDKSKELKIKHRLKHKLKLEMEKNPDFYKPLAEKLEEIIEERKQGRLTQLELFEEFDKIQQKILDKSKEAKNLGFDTEREFAVYKTLDSKMEGEVKETTATFFKSIGDELAIDEWEHKNQVQKMIRVKIKDIIRGRIPKEEIEQITTSLLDILKKN